MAVMHSGQRDRIKTAFHRNLNKTALMAGQRQGDNSLTTDQVIGVHNGIGLSSCDEPQTEGNKPPQTNTNHQGKGEPSAQPTESH